MSITVKKTGVGIRIVETAIARLTKSEVLVGIPAATAMRKGGAINNPTLAFLHEHGSPLQNIPARPLLAPSIEQNKALITPHLEAAATAILDKNPQLAERELALAGVVAANGAKRYVMQENHLAPNAPSTIKRKGSSRPLVDTTAMIRSVTSVVREKE